MKKYKFGIIGCGNMSQAIIKAMNSNCNDTEIMVSDLDESKLLAVRGMATSCCDNKMLVNNCDVVLLAVKPQSCEAILAGIDFTDKIIVSIMAGVSIIKLEHLTGANKIVRVMPNLNARVGMSFNGYCYQNLDNNEIEFVYKILSSFGTTKLIKENEINYVTGLAGSSPAYVFMFIKAFIDEGINKGFSPIVAREMALAAISGSAKLVENSPETDIDDLINSVCSKGGTTIQGVNFLRENNFENIVKTAINKAIDRAEELENIK